jgi:hypothetical protein
MYDELRDFLSDLHAGRMSRDILRVLPERHRQCVESFGIETCLRRDSGSGHEDYGDPIYVEALDEYVSLDDDGRRTMREVQGYLNDLAKKAPAEIARGIVDLAQMSDGVRRGRNARLEKLLKGHLTIEAHSAARVVRDALVSSDPLSGHVVVRMSGVAGRRYAGDFARRILKFLRIGKRGTA